MERQKKVIDASIAVKWFANEEGSDVAIDFRNKHINGKIDLIAPELFFMETLNALRYKRLEQNVLEKVNKDLWDIQLEIMPLNQFILNKAINLAQEYDFSIYDAIYAALAQMHGIELITEDEKLLKFPNSISLDKF